MIETGWEMPILLRALVLEIPDENILHSWPEILKNLLESDQLDKSLIIQNFDKIRDEWITQDLLLQLMQLPDMLNDLLMRVHKWQIIIKL